MTTNATAPRRRHHTRTYRILNHSLREQAQRVIVDATPDEIAQLADEGYLIRERVLPEPLLARLRDALDEAAAAERKVREISTRTPRFGGLFVENLMEKHPAFLEMRDFPPLLSVAKALMGPFVQVRGVAARISYPDRPNQQTHWHKHLRFHFDPAPPWYVCPHMLDCMLYLDDVTDATGPLAIVPGSHRRIQEDLAEEDYGEKPGQMLVKVPAGSCVFMHGSLWHRALPTRPDGAVRRLLVIAYSPTWMKLNHSEQRPAGGRIAAAAQDADDETRRLLGLLLDVQR